MNAFFRLLSLALCLLATPTYADEGTRTPIKNAYPNVAILSTESLSSQRDAYTVVDVRSPFEYNVLHVLDAVNIPQDGNGFAKAIKKLQQERGKPIVFYCNSPYCDLSFKAAMKAKTAFLDDIWVYDAGVKTWAKQHPELAVLMGETPVDTAKLISQEKLKQHTVPVTAFIDLTRQDSIVLDIREYWQADINLFPGQQHTVPLNHADELAEYLDKAKNNQLPLLMFDQRGERYYWVQYLIERHGITDYFFMQGGSDAYTQEIIYGG